MGSYNSNTYILVHITLIHMGWLRLVVPIKSQVFLAKEPYKRHNMYIFSYTYICIYEYMYMHMSMWSHVSFIYTYAYKNTYTHMYIYTYMYICVFQITGLFRQRALQKTQYSAKETCNWIDACRSILLAPYSTPHKGCHARYTRHIGTNKIELTNNIEPTNNIELTNKIDLEL